MAARTILVGGPDVSHGSLTGRDSANGHPTSAITGLDTALAERVAVGVEFTAQIADGAGGFAASRIAISDQGLGLIRDDDSIDYGEPGQVLTPDDVLGLVWDTPPGVPTTAADLPYDNTDSGLAAADTQAAIDEVVAGIPTQISTVFDALLDGAPSGLDTLNELAAAINDDTSFASTVTTALSGKVPTSRTLAGLDLSVDRSDSALRTALGLGTAATAATSDFVSSGTFSTYTGNIGAHLSSTLFVYLWNGSTYVAANTGVMAFSGPPFPPRMFVGPTDPTAVGFTMATGDQWKDTSV